MAPFWPHYGPTVKGLHPAWFLTFPLFAFPLLSYRQAPRRGRLAALAAPRLRGQFYPHTRSRFSGEAFDHGNGDHWKLAMGWRASDGR